MSLSNFRNVNLFHLLEIFCQDRALDSELGDGSLAIFNSHYLEGSHKLTNWPFEFECCKVIEYIIEMVFLKYDSKFRRCAGSLQDPLSFV